MLFQLFYQSFIGFLYFPFIGCPKTNSAGNKNPALPFLFIYRDLYHAVAVIFFYETAFERRNEHFKP